MVAGFGIVFGGSAVAVSLNRAFLDVIGAVWSQHWQVSIGSQILQVQVCASIC
jgi:hypothetical protein